MARKKQQEEVSASLEIEDIIKGLSSTEAFTSTEVLTTRKKVRTPCEIFNCLSGGGTPYGTVAGSFGAPGGGKSTMAYITGGYFLNQEPNGFLIIVDSESSADPNRLEELGVDPKRVIRILPSSIYDGFDKLIDLFKVFEKKQEVLNIKIPLYIVWDTMTKGRSEDSEVSSRMDAKNRARVIKSRMNDLIPWLDKLDVVMNNLSQVIITVDKYGNAKQESSGGVALKHDEHLRFYIEPDKHHYDDFGVETYTISYLTLDKTKISPRMVRIPLYLDVTKGGIIDEHKSVLYFFYDKGLFVPRGSFYNFGPLIEQLGSLGVPYYDYFVANFSGNYRFNDMLEGLQATPILYGLLRLAFMDIIGNTYALQKVVMRPYYDKICNELSELGVPIYRIEAPVDTQVEPTEEVSNDTANTDEEIEDNE